MPNVYDSRVVGWLRRRPPPVNVGARQLSLRQLMKLRRSATALVAVLISLGIGCRADPAADQFARRVLEKLQAGDSTAVALLQPNTPISEQGWASVRRVAEGLSQLGTDSLALVEWERGTDHQGEYRKLTYLVGHGSAARNVEVWLVSAGSKTYVNTIRIAPRLPAADAGT